MNIRLVNSNLGKAKTIETDVTTWGELKSLPEVSDMYRGNVKAVVRESQVTLEADTAALPTEDLAPEKDYSFSLFFVTAESKAGAGYGAMNFHALRSEVSSRGGNNNGKNRAQLISWLERDDRAEEESSSPSTCNNAVLNEINEKLDTVLAWIDTIEDVVVEEEVDETPTDEEMEAARTISSMV